MLMKPLTYVGAKLFNVMIELIPPTFKFLMGIPPMMKPITIFSLTMVHNLMNPTMKTKKFLRYSKLMLQASNCYMFFPPKEDYSESNLCNRRDYLSLDLESNSPYPSHIERAKDYEDFDSTNDINNCNDDAFLEIDISHPTKIIAMKSLLLDFLPS